MNLKPPSCETVVVTYTTTANIFFIFLQLSFVNSVNTHFTIFKGNYLLSEEAHANMRRTRAHSSTQRGDVNAFFSLLSGLIVSVRK